MYPLMVFWRRQFLWATEAGIHEILMRIWCFFRT